MSISQAMEKAADRLRTDLPSVQATAHIEGGGRYFNRDGVTPLDRFEPHHFTREHWAAIGFNPAGRAPWRASLALSKSQRRRMQRKAQQIDPEAAAYATSHGAFQIMGFHARRLGYASALDMVEQFKTIAGQIDGFVNFILANNLDGALRRHDWLTFASGYNGSGQARRYAALIAKAYRRFANGRPSVEILGIGSRGESVAALQQRLVAAGYQVEVDAAFGPATEEAVRAFQADKGLAIDGIVGARTWAGLEAYKDATVDTDPVPQDEAADKDETITEGKGAATGAGVGGALIWALSSILGEIQGYAEIILISALAITLVGGLILFRRQLRNWMEK